MTDSELKQQILELTAEWSRRQHSGQLPGIEKKQPAFVPGVTPVPYAARTFGEEEVVAAVDATLDFWLTLGKEGEAMESELAKFLGIRKSLLVNSGSSANLIALHALTSPLVDPDRRLQQGDEVITCAVGFPTTVAPIVQAGCVPVFLDNDPITGNIRTGLLEEAYVAGKTKAVMIAHSLGNPFDVSKILKFCRSHNLWLVEDNCDALGCTYSMPIQQANKLGKFENSPNTIPTCSNSNQITRWTGTWGDLSTQSFYPPHHLTMGEGGAVNIAGSIKLKRPLESFRDWGRDCYCASGKDNTCGKRFEWKLGELPEGYDHKYTYSHLGFNLKPLDIQAAIGRVQLRRLPQFIEARKRNWETLRRELDNLNEYFDFALPTHATKWTKEGFHWDESGCKTECSWFGFMLRVKREAPFSASDLARHLDTHKIGNRMLFGGNLIRQPALLQLKKDRPDALRIVGNLRGADELMHQALFLGTYPGLSASMIEYEINTIKKYVAKY
jgi:CDP-6-deoxy-D-xylo-4-hexulose-3-dehydrase